MSFSYINTFNNDRLLDFANEAYKYVNNGKPLESSFPNDFPGDLKPIIIGYATSFIVETAQKIQKSDTMNPKLLAYFNDLHLHDEINVLVRHYLRSKDAGHLVTFQTEEKGFQEKARSVRFLALHDLPLPQAKIAKLAELFPNVEEISLGTSVKNEAKPAPSNLNDLARFRRLTRVTLISCAGMTRAGFSGIARGRQFRCKEHGQDAACVLRQK